MGVTQKGTNTNTITPTDSGESIHIVCQATVVLVQTLETVMHPFDTGKALVGNLII